MATVYKVLPLSLKDNVLTVAIGDPANLPRLDDLRNFLGIKEVHAPCSPSPRPSPRSIAKCYAGKEESIMDIIQALEDDPEPRPAARPRDQHRPGRA